jgi:CheY-like chemotaxis protein
MKIMIVDDNAQIRRLLMSTLSHRTNEFVECSNGSEALTAFAHHQPDWTIMDVAMRPMGGLEATRRIKARYDHSRILILTQYDTPQMRAAALNAGATAFLSKDNLLDVAAILGQFGEPFPRVNTPEPPSPPAR